MSMGNSPFLPYRRVGAGDTVVLVHGYLGGSRQWQAEMDFLGDSFDVIAVDLAGYGDANHLQAPTTIADHARDVLATLDHLNVECFHLLGHSMGGMVVQEMVRIAPQRVARLVLYATGAEGNIPGRFETMIRSRERLAEDGVEKTARRICATWLLAFESSPAYPVLSAIASCASMQAAHAGLLAMEGWNGCERLAEIRQPTLIVWGEFDRSYSWSQVEILWKKIPGASLAVLPACAHALHLEHTTLFHLLLKNFLIMPMNSGVGESR